MSDVVEVKGDVMVLRNARRELNAFGCLGEAKLEAKTIIPSQCSLACEGIR